MKWSELPKTFSQFMSKCAKKIWKIWKIVYLKIGKLNAENC